MAARAAYESYSMQSNSAPTRTSTIVAVVSAAILCCSIMTTPAAHAAQLEPRGLSEGRSDGSLQGISDSAKLSLLGSAVVVGGSAATTGNFIVKSVSAAGEGSVVVLNAVGEAVGSVVEGSAELSVKITSVALTVAAGTKLTHLPEFY